MPDDIAARWTADASVTDYTDTDLEASRDTTSAVYDPDVEIHVLTETLRRHEGLDNWSETLDLAIRVGVADLLDTGAWLASRSEYDVAYTIPPSGWLARQSWPERDLVAVEEVDTDDPKASVTMPAVVHEMASDAVADGAADSLGVLSRRGLEHLLGHR